MPTKVLYRFGSVIRIPFFTSYTGDSEKDASQLSGAILYDPDSADDIDDDDPDEDLDI